MVPSVLPPSARMISKKPAALRDLTSGPMRPASLSTGMITPALRSRPLATRNLFAQRFQGFREVGLEYAPDERIGKAYAWIDTSMIKQPRNGISLQRLEPPLSFELPKIAL